AAVGTGRQRQRYNRGEIRMNSMARSPRTQALAEMWEQDQTNDRLRHAEMRKVYQERQDRAARHVRTPSSVSVGLTKFELLMVRAVDGDPLALPKSG
ncbi:hypothetical protein T484DRAFT_1950777, partial [Baffinella frigidus]